MSGMPADNTGRIYYRFTARTLSFGFEQLNDDSLQIFISYASTKYALERCMGRLAFREVRESLVPSFGQLF